MTDYPLYKDFYTIDIEKIKRLSQNIKNKIIYFKPENIKQRIDKTNIDFKNPYGDFKNFRFVLLEDNYDDNKELNDLTDYFTLEERIKSNFINFVSPLSYYETHKKEIYEYLKKKGIDKLKTLEDYRTFDRYMFDNIKFTNNFRISIIIKVLDIFKPKRWLDISAGWGDRLIAAILSPHVKGYHSTDPNLNLHKHYDKIIKTFNVSKKYYNIKKIGFENLKLRKNYYDLVFSSHTFFDMENYSNNKDDSLIKYPTDEKWYNEFLLKSINKSIEALKHGKYFILNISFYKKNKNLSRERLIQDINKKDYILFCGSFYYYNKENLKPREFLIMKKKINF